MSSSSDTYPFVVQEHRQEPEVHWDLMIHLPVDAHDPDQKILATWKLSIFPVPCDRSVPMVRLADHRRRYLTYQGPIGGGRGGCRIVDRGDYRPVQITSDSWLVEFCGTHLKGRFLIQKSHDPDQWILAKSEPAE